MRRVFRSLPMIKRQSFDEDLTLLVDVEEHDTIGEADSGGFNLSDGESEDEDLICVVTCYHGLCCYWLSTNKN